jgi:hypothetical protein
MSAATVALAEALQTRAGNYSNNNTGRVVLLSKYFHDNPDNVNTQVCMVISKSINNASSIEFCHGICCDLSFAHIC